MLRTATASDLPAIHDLLESVSLSAMGVDAGAVGAYVVTEQAGTIVGVAGLETHGRFGLLRSVAVEAAHRDRGLARELVENRLRHADEAGLETVYLLTETSEAYFAKRGFRSVAREEVPESIRESAEYSCLCPESAVVMRRDPTGG